MKNTYKHYEAPKAEVIEIESQGILCASVDTSTGPNGGGFQFGTQGGNW